MYQTHRTFIEGHERMSALIEENPSLLLLLEHFEIDFTVSDKTVSQLCAEYNIPYDVFVMFANLYNGFHPEDAQIEDLKDIGTIIRFLKNSHQYYKTDKYPEIISIINELQSVTGNAEVKLIENFFKDYFTEVLEHLDYEDKTAFPFFMQHAEDLKKSDKHVFAANDYLEHHTDIETKLADLKNLLLKHIFISKAFALRRKLFMSLLELEFDLHIHALIEEKILLPLIAKTEKLD